MIAIATTIGRRPYVWQTPTIQYKSVTWWHTPITNPIRRLLRSVSPEIATKKGINATHARDDHPIFGKAAVRIKPEIAARIYL